MSVTTIQQPSKAVLAELKEKINTIAGFKTRDALTTSQLSFAVPRGVLFGLSGPGKTEWVARFLAENKSMAVAWLEEELTLYPVALSQRKVDLERVLFLETGKHTFWAIQQVLRSHLFGAVVVSLKSNRLSSDHLLRRLTLFAEKAQAILFILTDKPHTSWNLSVQLHVQPTGFSTPMQVEVLRRKF